MSHAPIKLTKCNCGDASCDYHGLSDGKFPQGSGWDKETAERHMHAYNMHDELVSAIEMAHSYLCIKSIDGDTEGDMVRKGLAYTIRKARGEVV